MASINAALAPKTDSVRDLLRITSSWLHGARHVKPKAFARRYRLSTGEEET
ncbi:hypothetical protein ACQ858_14740 [Variovorax ureilyticus]|uniref:hypothetical protein n=1 Tax=Variovorax ureilyticus TaxID=1836198 RepID=UPI003D67A8BF